MKEKWMLKNKKADFADICSRFGVGEVIARLMVNRGVSEPAQIAAYLNPSEAELHPPFLLKGMEEAVRILREKIAAGKRIRIIGDYDVDGVVSTYVLYRGFLRLSAQVDYRIPDRIADGYGINVTMIEQAKADRIDTIVTCDNGIAASAQIAYAKELGMTVVVTDHHDIPYEIAESSAAETENRKENAGNVKRTVTGERAAIGESMVAGERTDPMEPGSARRYLLPPADSVINPKQPDCTYPFKNLCGAAVAYKLVEALYERAGFGREASEYIPYVAIATVCDVMELVEENRILVSLGLRELRKTKNKGLESLIAWNGLVKEQLSAYHLGFVIGPCLNATGRLKTAIKGVELLLAETDEEADALAEELKDLNDVRKNMTKEGVDEAIRIIETAGLSNDRVLVVYLPECHESLAGIIAGRIKEAYYKPTIVLTRSGEVAKGSARSIETYNIYEELVKCKDLLLKFGGHPMAAGLSLELDQVEVFRRKLNEVCTLTETELVPKVSIDVILPFGYVTEELCEELTCLEPFGRGNEKPLFAEREIKIVRAQPIGRTTKYFRFLVENMYKRRMEALFFGNAELLEEEMIRKFGEAEVRKMFQGRENAVRMSVTYYPSINEYNGNRSVQVVIQNYQL